MEAFVIKISPIGFLTVDEQVGDVYLPQVGALSMKLRSECYLHDRESAMEIFRRLEKFEGVELLTVDEARKRQQDDFEREKTEAIREANEAADSGKGLTEKEWDVEPDTYIGNCFKQCYSDQLMVKGSVYEYGVRGVYVCSGCGYAYAPGCEPAEVKKTKVTRTI